MNILKNIAFVLAFALHLNLHTASNVPTLMNVDAGDGAVDPDATTPRVNNVAGMDRAPSYHEGSNNPAEADVKRHGRIPAAAAFADASPNLSGEVINRPMVSASAVHAALAISPAGLPEDLAKKLAQLQSLQSFMIEALHFARCQDVKSNPGRFVTRFLEDFRGLQKEPWTAAAIAQLMQQVAAGYGDTNFAGNGHFLNNSETYLAYVCKDMTFETLSAACVEAMQVPEGDVKRGAEPVKAMLATLPIDILEQLARTSIRRDKNLMQATRYATIGTQRGFPMASIGCEHFAIHAPNSSYNLIMNALRASIPSAINEAVRPTFLLPPLIAIIMGYAPDCPPLSLQDLMGYRNFDFMISGPTIHGNPPVIHETNALYLGHNGLTDIDGIEAIAAKPALRDSYHGTLADEIVRLNLACNQLTQLPSLRAFRRCGVIDLSNNRLSHIPRGTLPKNPHTFLLAHNCLTEIPEDIMDAANIPHEPGRRLNLTVDLSGNPLLQNPEELKKIAELEALGVTVIFDPPAFALPQASKPD